MKENKKKTEIPESTLPEKVVIDPIAFIHQPHDKLMKYAFGIKEVAMEFLQFCMPENMLIKLDLDTFKMENNNFIDERMEAQYADAVFSIKPNQGDEESRISLLWEYKSEKDGKPISVQLFGYSHSALEADIKQNRKFRPPICIVIYHGTKKMKKERLHDLFPKTAPELKEYIPDFNYILLNINEMSDEQIINLNFTFLSNILLVLKHGRNPVKVAEYFPKMLIFARGNDDVVKMLTEITLFYLSVVSKLKFEDMNTLIEKLPKKKAKIVKGSFIHVLLEKVAEGEAKGKAEGEAKGKAEGEARGEAKTKREFAISLLKEFPDFDDAKIAKLTKVDEIFVRNLRAELKAKK